MLFKFIFVLVLVFVSSFFPLSDANSNRDILKTTKPRKLVVGGSQNWRFGFNYTDWAVKSFPFYVKDTLVFKYDAPSAKTFAHNVYLLPDLKSFQECDFTKARLIANERKGGGQGFGFTLRQRKTYFFACGEKNGLHCNAGLMKFAVRPMPMSGN